MGIIGFLFVNLLLPLSWTPEATATAHMSSIKLHKPDTVASLLQKADTPHAGDNKENTEDKQNKPEPLNLIFSPTAQQVSDEYLKFLDALEDGLHNLRNALNVLTKLLHLLPEEERQGTFQVDKESYTIADMQDTLDKLIVNGEKDQRVLMKGVVEVLHKLAVPSAKSQGLPAAGSAPYA
ncbi:hypothetical protein BgAZ_204260 [Babesia gibsoni]|uniref:Uncharacterized protein n=1 Tax=Babesia gibsoni TaxID=33632 RepID=A0AAD8P9F9_BABGI|nr:hypothetical protein BgAZ_204260 [Babesia gibsoni]